MAMSLLRLKGAAISVMVGLGVVAADPHIVHPRLPALQPIPGYTRQETITVPMDGSSVSSTFPLDGGAHYKLRASGQAVSGGPGFGDAEYVFDNGLTTVIDRCGGNSDGVDLGIGVNDTQNGNNKLPFWGALNVAHVYVVDFVGQGAPIILNYHDCNYSDNSGSLTVEVWKPIPPLPGFEVQESVLVPTSGSSVTAVLPLDRGVGYKLRASGTASVSGPGLGDAEYAFDNAFSTVFDTCNNAPAGVDLGIGVNDTTNSNHKFPHWGDFNPAHVYTIDFVGAGAPIGLNYHDCDYAHNSGQMTVDILRPTQLSLGVPVLRDFEDLPEGTAVYNQYDGVTFIGGDSPSHPILILPAGPSTASPTHALAVAPVFGPGCEFACQLKLLMQFDIPQFKVALSTGLPLFPPSPGVNYTILLEGFSSNPNVLGSVEVARSVAPCLGTSSTPLTTPLTLTDNGGAIRFARLTLVTCDTPASPAAVLFPPNQTLDWVDNLTYQRPLHPAPRESDPPLITITRPQANATVSGDIPGVASVWLQASITETALYSLTAQVNGQAPVPVIFTRQSPQTFSALVELTPAQGLADGANTVVLRAKDFDLPPNSGSASMSFVYHSLPVPPPSTVDIVPIAYQATQSIDPGPQPLGASNYISPVFRVDVNSAQTPLIQGKYTLVRIYGAAAGATSALEHVPATMDVYLDNCASNCLLGAFEQPRASLNLPLPGGLTVQPMGAASAPAQTAATLNSTWNFILYPGWTEHDLKVIIKLNATGYPPPPPVPECVSAGPMACQNNNTIELHLHFVRGPTITVFPVYVHVTGSYNGQTYTDVQPSLSQVDAILTRMNELYPAHVRGDACLDITVSPSIDKEDLLDQIQNYDTGNPAELFLGIFPSAQSVPPYTFGPNENATVAGYGSVGGAGAWSSADDPNAGAHELVHNIGFDHWACENGVTDDECGVFPIPHGGTGDFGTDLAGWKVIAPSDNSSNTTPHAHDFMSYGRRCGCNTGEWVSWYTYDLLLNHPNIDSYDTSDPSAIELSGVISSSGQVMIFHPFYRVNVNHPITDTLPAEDNPASIYTFQGYDASGNTLFVHNFEPLKRDVHGPDYGQVLGFREDVPDMPNLDRLDLMHGQRVVDSISGISLGTPPRVTINTPLAGATWPAGTTQTIGWTATTPKLQILHSRVQYSSDGGITRVTLAGDTILGTLNVNTDQLAGSSNAYIFVQVTDGLRSAEAQAGPFTVAPKPPSVHIIQPSASSQLFAHTPVDLQARAYDRQVAFSDTQYSWTSSRDGALGTGAELLTPHLSIGTQTLTVTVTDSHGLVGQDHVQVQVLPESTVYLPLVAYRH